MSFPSLRTKQMSTARDSPCKRRKAMSANSSSAQAVLQNPSSQPVLQEPPIIHIVMYNPGIQQTQVQSEALFTRWIIGQLKADVTATIMKHDADIIGLCELGGIAEGLGATLNKWKKLTVQRSRATTTWWKLCCLNSSAIRTSSKSILQAGSYMQ